jgi:hypothetical protein
MSAGDAKLGATTNDNTGHTEWPDGRVHHSGFTTTLTPNTRVPYQSGSATYDFDLNSRQEGSSATAKTFAAITSRSHHGGIVTIAVDAERRRGAAVALRRKGDAALFRRRKGERKELRPLFIWFVPAGASHFPIC